MKISIDEQSGFCFGVSNAIRLAEEELSKTGKLFCLGNIVHNRAEVERLKNLGLIVIDHQTFRNLKDSTVLIRAHGEPPETYKIAAENNIRLIDASCKVVLKIQQRLLKTFLENPQNQIVIYGKPNHPEVIGLQGQVGGKALVVQSVNELEAINFSLPVHIFSQTTMPLEGFRQITEIIRKKMIESIGAENPPLYVHDTVCRQVSNRTEHLRKFANSNDVVIFVSSPESSNGKLLFEEVKKVNSRSYFISQINEIIPEWFENAVTIGICGATSTPQWIMQRVEEEIKRILG
ncbi:MAG: 4-hydroxy-3-methylbut-2-enyl diphosphate reductase [Bacteroidales bacterium]|nr:4-hydroxy-3-methylbut-2-enyl diphosphate reductase [Bacteroidales bacterium]